MGTRTKLVKEEGNHFLSVTEDHVIRRCLQCGRAADTRPYGPKGTEICFECGTNMKQLIDHNMGIKLYGAKGELW